MTTTAKLPTTPNVEQTVGSKGLQITATDGNTDRALIKVVSGTPPNCIDVIEPHEVAINDKTATPIKITRDLKLVGGGDVDGDITYKVLVYGVNDRGHSDNPWTGSVGGKLLAKLKKAPVTGSIVAALPVVPTSAAVTQEVSVAPPASTAQKQAVTPTPATTPSPAAEPGTIPPQTIQYMIDRIKKLGDMMQEGSDQGVLLAAETELDETRRFVAAVKRKFGGDRRIEIFEEAVVKLYTRLEEIAPKRAEARTAPAASAPVTPVAVASAPVTPVAVASAPVTPVAVASAPVTPVAVASAPVTPVAVASAPVTPVAVASAPTQPQQPSHPKPTTNAGGGSTPTKMVTPVNKNGVLGNVLPWTLVALLCGIIAVVGAMCGLPHIKSWLAKKNAAPSTPIFEYIPTGPTGPSTSGAMVLGGITVATNHGGNSFGSISGGSTVIAIVGGSNVFGNIGGGSTTNYVVQQAPPGWPDNCPPRQRIMVDFGTMGVGEVRTNEYLLRIDADVEFVFPPNVRDFKVTTYPDCRYSDGTYAPDRFDEAINGRRIDVRGTTTSDMETYRLRNRLGDTQFTLRLEIKRLR
jgi:hypothetical protein